MDLSDEQNRIDAHAFVVRHFEGDYAGAVDFLVRLDAKNRSAHKTLYSQRYGFIDVHLSGDKHGNTALR